MALLSTDMIEEIRRVAEEYSAREHERRLSLPEADFVPRRAQGHTAAPVAANAGRRNARR